ncbi:hypothetical protein ABTX62_32170 [Streptomyces sp. NPDC096046]|uniref:hypothetical protein n=1 Tax=Streptomyces sp. NPDC096046 TaxID=3155542 RepID=UPI003318C710
MLTTLLPGFRHFRTPFAVGALCSFQLWIIFGENIPHRTEAQGLLKRVYTLGEIAGRPIVTAAIAFVLYLLGDIFRVSSNSLQKFFRRNLQKKAFLSDESLHRLGDFANGAFRVRSQSMRVEANKDRLIARMVSELPAIRMQLVANHLEVYLEHDRLDSESEFRINVALYSTSLWCVLGFAWSPLAFLGAGASWFLFMNGMRASRDANAILAQAVIAGIVESRRYAEELERDSETRGGVTISRGPGSR